VLLRTVLPRLLGNNTLCEPRTWALLRGLLLHSVCSDIEPESPSKELQETTRRLERLCLLLSDGSAAYTARWGAGRHSRPARDSAQDSTGGAHGEVHSRPDLALEVERVYYSTSERSDVAVCSSRKPEAAADFALINETRCLLRLKAKGNT